AASVALRPQLAEQHDPILNAGGEASTKVVPVRVQLRRAPRPRAIPWDSRRPQIFPDGIARQTQLPGDRPDGVLLTCQLPELLHGRPSQHGHLPGCDAPGKALKARGGGSPFDRRNWVSFPPAMTLPSSVCSRTERTTPAGLPDGFPDTSGRNGRPTTPCWADLVLLPAISDSRRFITVPLDETPNHRRGCRPPAASSRRRCPGNYRHC